MAPYSTTALLKLAFGEDRARAALSSLNPLELETRLEDAIESSSGYIDSYLSEGGYATPVDFTAITDADVRTRLEKLLSDVCVAIAVGRIVPVANRGVGRGTEKSADWAQNWLDRIKSGRVQIPGLPLLSRSRIAVVGDNTPVFPNSLFDTYKTLL